MQRISATLVCVMVFTALIGFSGAASAQQINIFSGSGHGFAPIFVADELGYFDDEGLRVNVVLFPSGSSALQAFRAGHAQFIATGDLPAARVWAEGGVVGLLPLEFDDERMIIASSSAIRSAEDLRGRTVATQLGSTGHYLLAQYLSRHGLTTNDVDVVALPPSDMVVALVRGEVDAFSIFQPYGWQAAEISNGRAHILTTGVGLMREYLLLSGMKSYVDSNPEVVSKVLRAVARGAEWLRTADEGERAKLVGEYINADIDLTARLLDVIDFVPTIDQAFRDAMDEMADFMQGLGVLSQPIDWDNHFEEGHARRADPALVTW